jgi:hypothetical protein
MTIETSSTTYTNAIAKAKSALALSWLTKGQKSWYRKCYTDEQWIEAISKAKIIQILHKQNPNLQVSRFIKDLTKKEIGRKNSPVHIAIFWILAGEPFKKAYFQRLGEPFFLTKDLSINNYYTVTVVLDPRTFTIDWTQYPNL